MPRQSGDSIGTLTAVYWDEISQAAHADSIRAKLEAAMAGILG